MRQCPVCDAKTNAVQCPVCGFDNSRDYEHAPTFAPTMSIAARRKAWQERLEANRQEQEWKAERDLTRVSLNAVENRCRQLTKENLELKDQLKDAETRAASAAENAELKAEYEKKQTKGFLVRCFLKVWTWLDALGEIGQRLEIRIESSKSISKFAYFILWSLTFLLSNFLVFGPLFVLIYGVMTIGHSALFHAPWSSAPCVVRDSCSYFVCAPEDHHEWSDSVCLEPQTCTVCGEKQGGTDAHVWRSVDVDGVEHCILCDAQRGNPGFFYSNVAHESIQTDNLRNSSTSKLLTFDDLSLFPDDGIYVLNFCGLREEVETSSSENQLRITFSDELPMGRYSVYDAATDQLLANLYYCRHKTPFPYNVSNQFVPFCAENLLTGQYLTSADGTLSMTDDHADAQYFEETFAKQHYLNWYLTQDNQWITLHTFQSNGRYLAANSNGTVYWSNELTDECYWLIQ